MDLGILGDVAIVTGGARGIGAAIAQALSVEGAVVAIWDKDREPAEALADQLRASGGVAQAFVGDVTCPVDVERVVAAIQNRFGPVQIVVNNAGFSLDAPIAEMTDDRWDQVYAVCLKATFLICRTVTPGLIAQGYGRLINVSSRTHGGEVNKSNYAAAKAGVIGLTKSLALELGRHSITANCVAPGLIRTERVMQNPSYADIDRRAKLSTPIQRDGTPADVADAVLYLASRRTGFVSGEVLHVAGGRK